jgi:hypothetical protein
LDQWDGSGCNECMSFETMLAVALVGGFAGFLGGVFG